MLDSTEACTPAQECIYGYLVSMLGNMQTPELRFVTCASVCLAQKIVVTFNNIDGLARRPIVHTCDFTIELPITYMNYDDFYHLEFHQRRVLLENG